MRNVKLAVLALGLIAALTLTGCGRRTYVTINGEKITKREFQTRLERLPVPGMPGAPPQQAGAAVMERLVNEMIILQLAKEKGVSPTEEQINNKLELTKKEGNLAQILQQRAITQDDFKRELEVNQAAINIITKGTDIKDEEVKKTYEEVLKQENSPFKRPESVEVALIMCSEKAKIDEAAGLLKRGTDFATVAMQISEDQSTKNNGGIAGTVVRNQRGVPQVIPDTAFKLKVNQVSDPVQADHMGEKKWFIIKSRSHKDAKTQSYNEVKEVLREQLALNKSAQEVDFNKMLEEFREKSEIKVKIQRYKHIITPDEKDKKDKKDKKDDKGEEEEN